MKFSIENIKIWHEKENEPRSLRFLPNKVNVITGESSTGKSNILAIIDYCLLSNVNNIVYEGIGEHAKWFSIQLSINDKTFIIGRKSGLNGVEESSVYFSEDSDSTEYPRFTSSLESIRNRLNAEFNSKDYRTYLLINYLTENMITLNNQYIDFNFFNYENDNFSIVSLYSDYEDQINTLTDKLNNINESINKANQEEIKLKKLEEKYIKSIEDLYQAIFDNKLLPYDQYDIASTLEEKSKLLRTISDNYAKAAKEEKNSNVTIEAKKELNNLNIRLLNLKKARKEFKAYKQNIDALNDSLLPIKQLETNVDKIIWSFGANQLISALSKSLASIKEKIDHTLSDDIVNDEEISKLTKKIQQLKKECKQSKATDLLFNTNGYAFMEAEKINSAFRRLKKPNYDNKPTTIPTNTLDLKNKLSENIKNLEIKKINLLNKLNESIQAIYDELKDMNYNSMGNYLNCNIKYSSSQNRVNLQKENESFVYRTIGSKSYEMFLHVCCFLGFHKLALENKSQQILPFLFVDQPSIPYYSKQSDSPSTDEYNLKNAFKLLNNFIEKYKEIGFQIILIEHAPPEYWKKELSKNDYVDKKDELSNFHTVEVFTDKNKLIKKT